MLRTEANALVLLLGDLFPTMNTTQGREIAEKLLVFDDIKAATKGIKAHPWSHIHVCAKDLYDEIRALVVEGEDPKLNAASRIESERAAAESRLATISAEREKNDREFSVMFERLGELSAAERDQLKADVVGKGKWAPSMERRLRDADPLESPFLASLMCEMLQMAR